MIKFLHISAVILSGGVMLSSSVLAEQSLDVITVHHAMAQAYNYSHLLQIARADVRRSDESVIEASAPWRPIISANAILSATNQLKNTTTVNNSSGLSIEQRLYDNGRTDGFVNSAQLNLLAARQDMVDIEQSVLLSAVTAFLNVRRDRQAVMLNENSVRVLREQNRAAVDRFRVGEVTRTDVSQTEARLAAAISALERAKGMLQGSIANYVVTVGKEPKKLRPPVKPPPLPKSVEEAQEIAMQIHPKIIATRYRIKSAEIARDNAKNLGPTITTSLSYNRMDKNSSPASDSLSIGINANLILYQGGLLASTQRKAAAALNAIQAQLRQNIAERRAQVYTTFANWIAFKAAKQSAREQIKSAELAFEGIQEEAKLGVRTTLDVLDAEQELLSAQSQLISATRDEFVASYTLLSETGLLTAKKLGLDVKSYDPKKNYNEVTKKSRLGERRLKLLRKLEQQNNN